ncbi:hypothetical protein EPN90_01330 [Patescibacteria group bacterium]|nr:MAG: hypothetical protein EPN90_01330 [Patescibacteria group bacterium]
MFDNDEKIIVLAQRLRCAQSAITVDSAFKGGCRIEGERLPYLLYILRHGHLLTVRELRKRLFELFSLPAQDVGDLLAGLYDLNLVTTNRFFARTAEELVMNPTVLPLAPRTGEDLVQLYQDRPAVRLPIPHSPQTPLQQLLAKRNSARTYANRDVAVTPARSLVAASYAGWNRQHRAIPSAGALYPCNLTFLLRRKRLGCYLMFRTESLNVVRNRLALMRVSRLFLKGQPFGTSPFIAIISANYERATKKYGVRGWRYAILEAGHIAQNLCLHASELGLTTCEVGAIREEACLKTLHLSEVEMPLIAVCGGYPSKTRESVKMHSLAAAIRAAYSGAYNIVPKVKVHRREAELYPERYYAEAQAALPIRHRGFGRSTTTVGGEAASRSIAVTKAVAEGVERFSAGWTPPPDVAGNICSIPVDGYIDPRDLQLFARNQRHPVTLDIFTKRSRGQWYETKEWNGKCRKLVLGDFLFYPYAEAGRRPFSQASSNGMAAHTDPVMALWKATAELLERESFLAWWFSGARPSSLPTPMKLLPIVQGWSKRGMEIRFADITTSIPAVAVIGIDRARRASYLATASGMDMDEALVHACSELVRSIAWESQSAGNVKPAKIRNVEDHLRCFAGGYAFRFVEWWSRGPEYRRESKFPSGNDPAAWLDWVIDNVGPIYHYRYALPPQMFPAQPLTVIRSIIPGVVSIRFGYGQQDLGLPRLRRLMSQCSSLGESRYRVVPCVHPLA